MGTLDMLLIAWGAVTAALICVLIYRSALSTREGDQIFLDSSAKTIADEQRAIVARLRRLNVPITALIVLSAALLLAVAAAWFWTVYRSF